MVFLPDSLDLLFVAKKKKKKILQFCDMENWILGEDVLVMGGLDYITLKFFILFKQTLSILYKYIDRTLNLSCS